MTKEKVFFKHITVYSNSEKCYRIVRFSLRQWSFILKIYNHLEKHNGISGKLSYGPALKTPYHLKEFE